jgi:DNA polymerase-3 subunit epsilon
MHDPAAPAAAAVIGAQAHPSSTLVDRVHQRLRQGPELASILCHEVIGLPGAPDLVCERVAIALLGADPRVRQLADGRWGLVAEAQGSPLLDQCSFAVVDVETTGMRAIGSDRITEIAVVVVQGGRREVVLDTLINPGRPIPPAICAITNITNDMVRDAPVFGELADQVLAALSGRIFVAHNARFDWNFVTAELQRSRDLVLDGPRLCTVRLARRLVRGIRSCGLDSLTRWFGFENRSRHRAAGDALVTAELLHRLLELARQEGARTLQDLAAIEARRTGRRARARRLAMPTPPREDSCPEAM